MLLKFLFIFFIISNVSNCAKESKSQIDDEEVPNDINSVSKFIKDFHPFIKGRAILNRIKDLSRTRIVEKELYPAHEFESSSPPSTPSSNENDFLPNFLSENATQTGTKNGSADKNVSSLVNCSPRRVLGSLSVELVNSTRLASLLMPDPNVTNRHMEADCVVLLFYSKTCPFSCLAAPHFNALPRAFPSIKMAAVNAMVYTSYNTQYGIAGVPTVMLFHNGRAVAKFNDSEYTLKMFAKFIIRFTGMKPVEKMFVSSSDFGGPVPSRLTRERDYVLGLAWAVILIALGVGISRSKGWRNLVEAVQNTWREAQAHHEHTE